jgi:deazaflavin-dependent oxidoreductase (nitroreductase family)
VRVLFRVHVLLYRATGGLIGHRLGRSTHFLLLTTTGAKTRLSRVSPLLYGRDGGRLVVVASQGGTTKNPAWYHNLRAHPQVTVQIGRERWTMHAREATGDERPRLWQLMTRQYPGYDGYQQRTARRIPVIVLEPV